MKEVERVLGEIGAGDVNQVVVFNKIDRLDETERPRALTDSIELAGGRRVQRIFVSAVSGEGLDALRQCIAERVVRVPDDSPALNQDAEASVASGVAEGSEPDGEGEGQDLHDGTYHSLA